LKCADVKFTNTYKQRQLVKDELFRLHNINSSWYRIYWPDYLDQDFCIDDVVNGLRESIQLEEEKLQEWKKELEIDDE